MQVLHLIRKKGDAYPLGIVSEHLRTPENRVLIVCLQDAVYDPPELGAETVVLDEDCAARGVVSDRKTISYEGLIDLIFASDRVYSW